MAGLQDFHHSEDKPDKTQRLATWIAVVLILGGVAFYVVASGMLSQHPQQAGQQYPRGL
jgi:hypothetical protein